MKDKHLIIVSVDALVYEDLEYAKTLPMFSKLLENGSVIEKVKTIYPSLTHPVHATIMSGCTAGKTGIVSNETFEVKRKDKIWFNHLNEVKCDTLFHAAKRKGLTTAACRWPVTAGDSGVIDYLVPEIMGTDVEGQSDMLSVYRKLGCGENVIDIVEKALNLYGEEITHPVYDEVQIYCAAEIIKKYKPNVLFTHPGYVDNMRHKTGLFTDRVKESVKKTDEWLCVLYDAVCKAGIEDSTDFVVLSDHGHVNIVRTVCVNVFLRDAGLITLDDNGDVSSWDAYVASGGASAHVYLSRPDDKELYNRVYKLLKNMADEKIYGFDKVFTTDEVKSAYGLFGDFSFVLETDGYTGFNDDWERPCVRDININDYRYGKSTHGHMPEKGPQPPFIAMGPSFRKGVVIPTGSILNHAPTFAKVLGIELSDAEGKPVVDILK